MSQEERPRVTGVLDLLSKPQLIPWAARLGVEHMQKELVTKVLNPVTSIVNETKEMTMIKGPEIKDRFTAIKKVIGEFLGDSEEIIKTAKAQHKLVKNEKADKGKRIHSAVEDFLRADDNAQIEVGEDIEHPMRRFVSWWILHEVEAIETEFSIWSEDGGGWRGTFDLAGNLMWNGRKVLFLIDFKSGPKIYDDALMQVAAYFYGFKQRSKYIPEMGAVLRLPYEGPEQFLPIPEAELYLHYKRFLKLVEYWHLSKGIK